MSSHALKYHNIPSTMALISISIYIEKKSKCITVLHSTGILDKTSLHFILLYFPYMYFIVLVSESNLNQVSITMKHSEVTSIAIVILS